MPATPKPPFLYAPASESTSKDGLSLAVFTLEDAQPSPFWSTPQALEWAIHPVGVPSSLAGVLPIEPMDSEATSVLVEQRW